MAGSTDQALSYFPQPYRPLLEGDRLAEVDNLTIREKLEQLELEPEEFDAVEGMWATNFNGRTEDGSYAQALRWCALAGGSWQLMFEACATYKIAGGTRGLIEAMADGRRRGDPDQRPGRRGFAGRRGGHRHPAGRDRPDRGRSGRHLAAQRARLGDLRPPAVGGQETRRPPGTDLPGRQGVGTTAR